MRIPNNMRKPSFRRNVSNVRRNVNAIDRQKEDVKEHVENFNEIFVKAKIPASTQIWVEKKTSGSNFIPEKN